MNVTPICPYCHHDMRYERGMSNTYNHTTKQVYEVGYYGCKACDVWITLETPEEDAGG